MRSHLPGLQENDEKTKALRDLAGLPEDWKDVEKVLQYQELPYMPKIIRFEIKSCHYNDSYAGYFGIDKTQELIG